MVKLWVSPSASRAVVFAFALPATQTRSPTTVFAIAQVTLITALRALPSAGAEGQQCQDYHQHTCAKSGSKFEKPIVAFHICLLEQVEFSESLFCPQNTTANEERSEFLSHYGPFVVFLIRCRVPRQLLFERSQAKSPQR
jgi:hypothetical protein